jgi:hypothetical protein
MICHLIFSSIDKYLGKTGVLLPWEILIGGKFLTDKNNSSVKC